MASASLTPRESVARARAIPPFALNSSGTHLADDGVLVRRTPTGFVCLGMGSGAEAMHAAFASEDDALLAKLDASKGQPAAPLGLEDAPGLRRLALLEALLKDGYNPNQPRDEHGRWTEAGSAASAVLAAGAADVALPAAGIGAGEVVRNVLDQIGRVSIPRAVAIGSGIGTFVSTMLTPANLSALHEGTIAGRPDINYRYAEGELTLWRQEADGGRQMLYSGVPDLHGVYRDEEGHVIGHSAGNTFNLDGAVLPALSAKAKSKPRPHIGARDQSLADTSEPEVCPEPGPDWPGNASTRAMDYQRQIAHQPEGPDGRPMVAWYHGVAYDGCSFPSGNLLEAKEGGYATLVAALEAGKDWPLKWKKGSVKAMGQMVAQSKAAPDRRIEWHFSEPSAAAFFARYAEKMHLTNVQVFHTPAVLH